jgi:hypothetical protein
VKSIVVVGVGVGVAVLSKSEGTWSVIDKPLEIAVGGKGEAQDNPLPLLPFPPLLLLVPPLLLLLVPPLLLLLVPPLLLLPPEEALAL